MISLHKRTEEWKEEVLSKGTMMHIYFKELGVVKYQRDELYGAMDVIGKSRVCSSCCCICPMKRMGQDDNYKTFI